MVVTSGYTIGIENHTPHSAGPRRCAHDEDVLRVREIDAHVADLRGTRTEGKRMVIPLHNTQGETGPEQYRPHDPGDGPKYLFSKGTRLILDVHPLSYPHLRDRSVSKYIAESALKADAMISAFLRAGIKKFCVLSISGVYGWRQGKEPLTDFGDLKWHGHTVYIAFDSDVMTNPKVSRARWEFSQFLERKKARVLWIDVPAAADGGKQGIDDALHTAPDSLPAMIASAYPAPDTMPIFELEDLDGMDLSELERARAEVDYWKDRAQRLAHDRAALIGLITNPYVKSSTKEAIVSTYVEVAQAAPDDEGRVEVTAGKVSRDFRKSVDAGEERAKLNEDGSRPLMARSSVKTIIRDAAELHFIDVKEVPRAQKRKGQGLPEYVWRVKKPETLSDFLQNAVTFALPGVEPRKSRTQTPVCPSCGVRHDRRVDTICLGCGQVIDTTIIEAQELTAADVEAEVQERTTEQDAIRRSLEKSSKEREGTRTVSAPAPLNVSREKNSKERDTPGVLVCSICNMPRSGDSRPCPACGAVGRKVITPPTSPPERWEAQPLGVAS